MTTVEGSLAQDGRVTEGYEGVVTVTMTGERSGAERSGGAGEVVGVFERV